MVLEGDFRGFNDFRYQPFIIKADGSRYNPEIDDSSAEERKYDKTTWEYKQNHCAINFGDRVDLNNSSFLPIGKLQLLAFNTGESYPFADRLIEYLSNSTITPIDEIADNVKRTQKVMSNNHHYFKIEGIWESKMQKILYDYVINSGPIKVKDGKLIDQHSGQNPSGYGYHPTLGHSSKSSLYDILGYVDKDVEKWYASWTKDGTKAKIRDSIQNIDIYNGLYDDYPSTGGQIKTLPGLEI